MKAQTLKSHVSSPRQVVTISPSAPARDALKLMAEHRIHHLVVMDGDSPQGIVSDRELVPAAVGGQWLGSSRETTVGEVMRVGVPPITDDTELGEALHLMIQHGVSGLPIVHRQRVTGILTETDLLRLLDSVIRDDDPIDVAVQTGRSWISSPAFQKLLKSLADAGI